MANVKIEPSDDIVLIFLDSKYDVCPVLDHFDISHFYFRTRTPTQPFVFYRCSQNLS